MDVNVGNVVEVNWTEGITPNELVFLGVLFVNDETGVLIILPDVFSEQENRIVENIQAIISDIMRFFNLSSQFYQTT